VPKFHSSRLRCIAGNAGQNVMVDLMLLQELLAAHRLACGLTQRLNSAKPPITASHGGPLSARLPYFSPSFSRRMPSIIEFHPYTNENMKLFI
jgi:hypothetical protein